MHRLLATFAFLSLLPAVLYGQSTGCEMRCCRSADTWRDCVEVSDPEEDCVCQGGCCEDGPIGDCEVLETFPNGKGDDLELHVKIPGLTAAGVNGFCDVTGNPQPCNALNDVAGINPDCQNAWGNENRCDSATGNCVACRNDGDCSSGYTCSSSTKTCVVQPGTGDLTGDGDVNEDVNGDGDNGDTTNGASSPVGLLVGAGMLVGLAAAGFWYSERQNMEPVTAKEQVSILESGKKSEPSKPHKGSKSSGGLRAKTTVEERNKRNSATPTEASTVLTRLPMK